MTVAVTATGQLAPEGQFAIQLVDGHLGVKVQHISLKNKMFPGRRQTVGQDNKAR
jgi:hypothetical protein